MKGLDIASSVKDAKLGFSHAIDQFQQGNHGLAAMSALGGLANLANAVGRFGEIRKLMNCDLAGARMLGLPCFVAGTLVSTSDWLLAGSMSPADLTKAEKLGSL